MTRQRITWPDSKSSAATFSFDFDAETVWIAMDPQNALRPGALSVGHYGARVGLPAILDMLSRVEVRATFFVVGQNVERYPDAVRRILADGHEVAIHGYTHTPPQMLGAEAEAAELSKAIDLLRGIGADPRGYRSPSWDVSPVTLDLLAKAGLAWSSQMMADIQPYRHASRDLIELPIQWLLDDWPFFAFNANHMDRPIMSAAAVEAIWQEELDGIVGMGGHFLLTMHPQIIGRPGRLLMLERLIRSVKARDEIWLATCGEVAAHAAEVLPREDVVSVHGLAPAAEASR